MNIGLSANNQFLNKTENGKQRVSSIMIAGGDAAVKRFASASIISRHRRATQHNLLVHVGPYAYTKPRVRCTCI